MNKADRAHLERVTQEHIRTQALSAVEKVLTIARKLEPALQELRAFAELLGQPLVGPAESPRHEGEKNGQ